MNKKRKFRPTKSYLFSRPKLNQDKEMPTSKQQRIKGRLGIQIVNNHGKVVDVNRNKTLKDRHNIQSAYTFISFSHAVGNNRHRKQGEGGVYPPIGLADK